MRNDTFLTRIPLIAFLAGMAGININPSKKNFWNATLAFFAALIFCTIIESNKQAETLGDNATPFLSVMDLDQISYDRFFEDVTNESSSLPLYFCYGNFIGSFLEKIMDPQNHPSKLQQLLYCTVLAVSSVFVTAYNNEFYDPVKPVRASSPDVANRISRLIAGAADITCSAVTSVLSPKSSVQNPVIVQNNINHNL
jgi:hypothetical protein